MTTAGIPKWARMSEARRQHVDRVVQLLSSWADVMSVDDGERDRWIRAACFHDAVKDADEEWLTTLAGDYWGVPALAHGPAAAVLASQNGERDQGVLNAVRYHSVGYEFWDGVGRMLYLADFLEPGRNMALHDGLRDHVVHAPDAALRQVAAHRIAHAVHTGKQLVPETIDFWNALV